MELFDHVIVGGGVVGAAVAYHLAQKGGGSIVLLERNALASAASSQAAGLILQASTKPAKTPLAKRTVETIPVLEDAIGETIGFHQVGSLRIATSDGRTAEIEAAASDAAAAGIPVTWPDAADVGRMVPWLNTDAVRTAAFFPTDGYIDPYRLSMAYIAAARALGVVVRQHTDVRDIRVEGEAVCGVTTTDGAIACGTLINACGAAAAVFSERAGYPLPMAPVRSHFWIAEPDAAYGGEHPVTLLPDCAAYTRPEVGGLVLGVQEPRSTTFDARDVPDDPAVFSPTAGDEHWDVLSGAFEAVAYVFPGIERARFSSYICGLSAYTPDGEIILGPVPGASGFYAAAGDCGSGVTLSAGIGDAAADLALGRTPAFDIDAFRPDRFGRVDPFGQPFRDRCAAARASKSRRAPED